MTLTVSDLKSMTVPELKKALLERKLNVVGKKQDLINRLTEFLDAEAAKTTVAESEKETSAEKPAAAAQPPAAKPAVSETPEATKENAEPQKEEPVAVKPISEMTEAERLKLRAEKFGVQSDELKKQARAERFGVTLSSTTSGSAAVIKSSDVSVDSDTLKRRAERFGQVTNSKLAKIEDSEKKAERAKKFGMPNSDPTAEAAAKEARAERFKGQLGEPEDELKKKRAERFGLISAA